MAKKIILNNQRLDKIKPGKKGGEFTALARAIIFQQLAGKAAESIYNKFINLFPDKKLSPELVLKLKEKDFKSAGVSAQKQGHLLDLSRKFLDGTVNPKDFKKMSDDDIRQHLIAVKGIGVWTADMFLIFNLKRPNVLPLLDLGIKNGFKKYFGLDHVPTADEMLKLAKPYNGSWTELSLFLWEYKDNN